MLHSSVTSRAVLAAALAGCLLPFQALGDVVFETIEDPAFVGWGPGPDGFIGTGDDVPDPTNTAGAVTYGISPVVFSESTTLYSESTTTINEPFVFENGTSTITDFTTSGSVAGVSFVDVASIPFPFPCEPEPGSPPCEPGIPLIHEMLTDLQGRTDGEYSLCIEERFSCEPPINIALLSPAGIFNQSSRGLGFFLRRGEDPYGLPGIEPALASYLDQLTGVVPADWTAITIKAAGKLECADWDPEQHGYLNSSKDAMIDFYLALDPFDRGTEFPNSRRYVYLNLELVDLYNSSPSQPARITKSDQLGFLVDGQVVGVQRSSFFISPDGVCLFDRPGRIKTLRGGGDLMDIGDEEDRNAEWTRNTGAGLNVIGGVVATVSTSPIEFIVLPVPIAIDIKPDSDDNPINPSGEGVIPVAILGSPGFDVSDIDVTTLAFGPGDAAPAHSRIGHFEDANAD
ncbi:MAG: hypothetical protein IH884_15770, partial [Myxococcales bacterium]|nr:hypothetical protein [Myxococcales bacterium]